MNAEIEISKSLLWTKKLGETHIINKNETFCEKPMLGNNYPPNKDNMCNECCKKYLENEEIKITLKFKLI